MESKVPIPPLSKQNTTPVYVIDESESSEDEI